MPVGEARVGTDFESADSLTRVERACRLTESQKGRLNSARICELNDIDRTSEKPRRAGPGRIQGRK
jgi:hypothetical protein